MGLDMYLSAKKYMSKYFDPKDTEKIKTINELFGIAGDEDGDYHAQEVIFRVGYWRKANAVHKWFVDNCQGGVDECQETFVHTDKLKELLEVCKTVRDNKEQAHKLLPSASGFFFGSVDYDEWYFDCVDYTIKQLERVLNDPALSDMNIYYQSSW